jgi:tetratricopeptide (TPR) repeat protein
MREGRSVASRLGRHAIALLACGALVACGGTAEERASRLLDRGEEERAEQLARAHLAESAREHGEESLEAARALDLLVEVRQRRGAGGAETLQLAERALRLKEDLPEVPGLELATSLVRAARARADTGEIAAALDLLERAEHLRDVDLGAGHPEVAEVLAVRSYAHLRAGNVVAGREAAERSLELRQEAFGRVHRDVAESLILLSYAAQFSGDLEQATALRREAVSIREQVLGPRHPEVGTALMALGEILLLRHDAEARPVLERALAILEKTRGPGAPAVRDVLNNLALAVGGEGDLQAARRLYERILELPVDDESQNIAAWQNLGSVLSPLGELEAARQAYEKALSLAQEAGAPPDSLARHQHNLAFVLILEGRHDDARKLRRWPSIWLVSRATPAIWPAPAFCCRKPWRSALPSSVRPIPRWRAPRRSSPAFNSGVATRGRRWSWRSLPKGPAWSTCASL